MPQHRTSLVKYSDMCNFNLNSKGSLATHFPFSHKSWHQQSQVCLETHKGEMVLLFSPKGRKLKVETEGEG